MDGTTALVLIPFVVTLNGWLTTIELFALTCKVLAVAKVLVAVPALLKNTTPFCVPEA